METIGRTNPPPPLQQHLASFPQAVLDLKAIDQFNHTRFMEQKAIEEKLKRIQESKTYSSNYPETSILRKHKDVLKLEGFDSDISESTNQLPRI